MISNYLKVAIRNLMRNKTFSAINILGLAIGMACCMLILLYVQDELSYDRHHKNANRIYRLATNAKVAGVVRQVAMTPFSTGPALVEDYAEVIDVVRFLKADEKTLVGNQQDHFYESSVLFTDANVFHVFDFPLRKGEPQTALLEPNSIVLTQEMAWKYFGDRDPMGQTLTMEGEAYKITGILEDHAHNTHLTFDFLASPIKSKEWIAHDYYTYLLLQDTHAADELETKLPDFTERHIGRQTRAAGLQISYFLQPLADIHLNSSLEWEMSSNSDIRYVYLFLIIAFFVLLLACVNFTNLSTARSTVRSREVSMRKVVGANGSQLFRQFMGESILLAVFASFLAVVLVEVSLPAFSALISRKLDFDYAETLPVLLVLIGVTLFAGTLSGIYPALILSALQPAKVLNSTLKTGLQKSGSRKFLVVFQFAISVVLIFGTIVVYDQSDYIRNKKLGFDKEQVVVLPYPGIQVSKRYKSKLSGYADVLSTATTSSLPGRPMPTGLFRSPGDGASEDGLGINKIVVDNEFVSTLGLELAEGRDFSKDISRYNRGELILNEAAMRKFGWTSCVGKELEKIWPQGNEIEVEYRGKVVGVVKDFHYQSFHHEIEPLIITTLETWFEYFVIRIRPDNIAGTLRYLEAEWGEIAPNTPFDYFFLDDDYDKLHRAERQIGELFGLFSLLAILIASLGLFGLASFSAQQRIKEIGVRKVLGASVSTVVLLLSRESVLLVGLANLIAWPISYYAMNAWLQNFAYRIELDVWPFVMSGFLALFIALTTVSHRAWRAACTNPVDALRNE